MKMPMPPQPRPHRRRRRVRWRFRKEWILIPGLLLMVMWVLAAIVPTIDWGDIMHTMGVRRNELRYSQLAMLCCVGLAVVWIFSICRPKDDEQ